ncbi:MAG: hypothetical protein U1A77_02815 [Pirellulales bacterium]
MFRNLSQQSGVGRNGWGRCWGWSGVALLAILSIASLAPQAVGEDRSGEFPWQLSLRRGSVGNSASQPTRGGGGGGIDIVVFDIVDSVASSDDRGGEHQVVMGLDGELYLVEEVELAGATLVLGLRYSF